MKNHKLAFVFDMDGVIVDNHEFHHKAWLQFFEKYHLEVTNEDFKHHINGRTIMEVIYYLFGDDVDQKQAEAYADEKEALYRSLYKKDIQPLRGLHKFLEQLKSAGYLLAICTSAPQENIRFTLDRTATTKYFDKVVDMDGVSKGKPHPEIYQKAARELNLDPAQCLVFEDSISGIQSAKAAGCPVVALATTHNCQELEQTASDLIYADFEEVQLDEVLRLV